MHEGVLRSAPLRDAGDRADGTFGYILDFTDGLLSFMGTIEDAYPVNVERLRS